jgi:maltose 6'-phosphate phosphatase
LSVNRGWNPASAVRVVTKIDGVPIAFYSLHISGWKENKRNKRRQKNNDKNDIKKNTHAYQLATEVLPKEPTGRVIVVGDFNNNMGDTLMNEIEASGFRPTWKDLKIDTSKQFTYNAQDPKTNHGVIDHILYNSASGAKATDGAIIELKKPLSDHKPIWAEVVFPRELKKVKKTR